MKSLFNGRHWVAPEGSTPTPAPVSDYRKSYSLLFRREEREKIKALAEVERLKNDPLPAAAWVREVERAAYRRGAEAMREVAAAVVDCPAPEDR